MFKKMEAAVLSVLSTLTFYLAVNTPMVMSGGVSSSQGFSNFERNLTSFFEGGLGGDGLKGLGTAMIFIGIFGAGAMFLWHKLNQQSPMPRPGTMVAVAIVGAMIQQGDELKRLVTWLGNSIMGWFGL